MKTRHALDLEQLRAKLSDRHLQGPSHTFIFIHLFSVCVAKWINLNIFVVELTRVHLEAAIQVEVRRRLNNIDNKEITLMRLHCLAQNLNVSIVIIRLKWNTGYGLTLRSCKQQRPSSTLWRTEWLLSPSSMMLRSRTCRRYFCNHSYSKLSYTVKTENWAAGGVVAWKYWFHNTVTSFGLVTAI